MFLLNIIFFCHQLIFLINFFFIHDIFFLSCLKGFYIFRDLNRLLILHVTWSRCLMRFKVLVMLLLFIFICKFLTLKLITLAIINHIFWWTLEQRSCACTVHLWELIFLFIKLIFDIHFLIVFLIYKISSFFFILALGLVFQDFRLGLSLLFFIIDFVISSLNLNIMLHAFFQKTFIVKGFQHLH